MDNQTPEIHEHDGRQHTGLPLISQSPVSTFASVSLASEIRHAGHLSDSRNFFRARAPHPRENQDYKHDFESRKIKMSMSMCICDAISMEMSAMSVCVC
jgi:hypothetical protein